MYTITSTGNVDVNYANSNTIEITAPKGITDVVNKPWGSYKVLAHEEKYQIKEITILPGQMPSYQSHKFRSELWVVVSGRGLLILSDNMVDMYSGTTFAIEVGEKHRPINNGIVPLVFIEIQTGSSFDENDIVRYDDIYSRDCNVEEISSEEIKRIRGLNLATPIFNADMYPLLNTGLY